MDVEPGVVVGIFFILLVTSMVVATIVVVWRSRPAAIRSRAKKQRERRRALVLEAKAKQASIPVKPPIPADTATEDTVHSGMSNSSASSTTGSDTDTNSISYPKPVLPHISNSVPALHVMLAPHLLGCLEEGGETEEDTLKKPPPATLGELPSFSRSSWWFM